MNLPNKLSLGRILSIPIFLILALLPAAYTTAREPEQAKLYGFLFLAAWVIAAVVAATDWLDGYIARKYQLVTPLGKLLDPLADKVFVTAALVVLAHWHIVASWFVVIVISREFLVTGLRQLASEQNRAIPSDSLGKHKTGWQLAVILVGLCWLSIREFATAAGHGDFFAKGSSTLFYAMLPVHFTVVIALFLTVISGVNYLRGNEGLLKEG